VSDASKPIVRRRVKSIRAKVKSGYSRSLRTWGFEMAIQLEEGERMAKAMAEAFVGLKMGLKEAVPGIIFNAPEIFPVDQRQCIVLVTGWRSEIIMLS
jgi:hypothetical protein